MNYVTKGTSGMGRLMVGNLLRDMLERMVAVVHGMTDSIGQGPPRLVIYSAHDTTLMGLLSALGVGDTMGLHMPPVGSHMEIELREDVVITN